MAEDRDARVLELDTILESLAGECQNPVSREGIRRQAPETRLGPLEERYQENREAVRLLGGEEHLPVLRFPDIREHLRRTRAGGALNGEELGEVLSFLQVEKETADARARLPETPLLAERIGGLPVSDPLRRQLLKTVDRDGRILDSASSKLASLRRSTVALAERIRRRMEALVHGESAGRLLQDALVTIRNDRYVVPVRSEYRNRVPGIVHDQSASGATVYVEPAFAVELNNQLRELELEEQAEIRRILREAAQAVAERADCLRESVEILGALDQILARARLSRRMDAVSPRLNRDGFVSLRQARHPLLKGDVVPNDLEMDENNRCILITGPNTGGKTVCLKTLGLLALMVRLGLDIPCRAGSEMAVFDGVYADIGDEQSIEQSLSTFSSHMTNMIRIVRKATPDSLVLLDELGAGTDPAEGAALAAGLLEHFRAGGMRLVATTHFGELKSFAYQHEGVINACVEFDRATLRPTYRLRMGTPGQSNALDIAKRLGLPEEITGRARGFLSQEERDVSGLIRDLEQQRVLVRTREEEIREKTAEIEALRQTLEERTLALEQKERQVLDRAYQEAEGILLQARRQAEDLIGELRIRLRDGDRGSQLTDANEARNRIRDGLETVRQGRRGREASRPREEGLRPGETVYVRSLGQSGIILQPPGDKGEMVVQIGIVKTNVSPEDVERREEADQKAGQASYARLAREKSEQLSAEVDLRGQTSEEAVAVVEKYLDDVVLSNLERVRILHGKGSGALRRAVTACLKSHRGVASFADAPPEQGGSGVTVVTMKR